MTEEKGLLERRLVIPLAHPDVADRFGVAPPRAVVLFGPPGTGKTTFAKAIASRLEWPFVEVFPSRLAADPAGLAGALRETFTKIAALAAAAIRRRSDRYPGASYSAAILAVTTTYTDTDGVT